MSLINRILNPRSTRILQPLQASIPDLFSRDPFFRSFEEDWNLSRTPDFDLIETPESFIVKADVPGFTKDQISVDVEGSNLVIKGQKQEEKEDKNHIYALRERSSMSFQRSIPMATAVDIEKVKANLNAGVLEVQVPKDAERQAKKIQIEG
jgi:HSP20 family protein